MIKTFKCKETETIFYRHCSQRLPHQIQERARQKLLMLNSATDLNALRVPPANRLEALKHDREGSIQHPY